MFKALLRTRLKAFAGYYTGQNQASKGKKSSKGKTILMAILMGYVLVVFVGLFFGLFTMLARAFGGTDYQWLYFTLCAILAFGLMFIGSVFSAKAQLYEAKDNELLLAMPIPPKYILASRMLVLLLFNLLFQLVVVGPAFVAWALGPGWTLVPAVAFWLLMLGLNLFTMALICLAAWGISLITGRLEGKKALKNIATMVLFAAFFGLYMIFVTRANEYILLLAASGEKLAGKLGAVAPLVWLGRAMAEGDLLYLALCLAVFLGSFVLVYWVLSRSFVRIVTTRRGAAKIKYEEKAMKTASPAAALMRREVKRLTGSTGYMMNAGLSALFCLILAVALPFLKEGMLPALEAVGMDSGTLSALAVLIVCGICGMFAFTASAVSLEGSNLWIIRSMPVATAHILEVKQQLHVRIAVVSAVLPALSAAVFLPVEGVFVILPCITYASLTASIGLMENLRHPKLDWTNEIQPVKQGLAVIFTMLLNWAVLLVAVLVCVLLRDLVEMRWLLLGCAIAFLFLDRLLTRWIRTKGVLRFEAL